MVQSNGMILFENRKARFDYEITQILEAGIALEGWEVKSLRQKNGNLRSAWIKISNGEAFIQNFKIAAWRFGDTAAQDTLREKKLLLHKNEILKIEQKVLEKKVTLLPLKIYLSKGKIKCEIGVGKGRKKYEKRQVLKERSMNREAQKAIKNLT